LQRINKILEAICCSPKQRNILVSSEVISCKIGYIGMMSILAMMSVTVIDVFLRWFGYAILGCMEITELLLGIMAFYSFSWCYCEDKHLKIEVVTEKFSDKTRCITNLLGSLVGLIFFGSIAWGAYGFAIDSYMRKEVTPLLNIPLFPIKAAIGIASVLFVFQLITISIDRVAKIITLKRKNN